MIFIMNNLSFQDYRPLERRFQQLRQLGVPERIFPADILPHGHMALEYIASHGFVDELIVSSGAALDETCLFDFDDKDRGLENVYLKSPAHRAAMAKVLSLEVGKDIVLTIPELDYILITNVEQHVITDPRTGYAHVFVLPSREFVEEIRKGKYTNK